MAFASGGEQAEFELTPQQSRHLSQQGFSLQWQAESQQLRVSPPPRKSLVSIRYQLTVPLRNFDQVIVPDTGRTFAPQRQLVDFWAKRWNLRANNILLPVFVFTGLDGGASLAFGVVGGLTETELIAREPIHERALQAWMKRLTLQINRGSPEHPLADGILDDQGTLCENLFLWERPEGARSISWVEVLGFYGEALSRHAGQSPRSTQASLEPWWCPWTDYHSDQVTDQVMERNVTLGLELGIRNYIIDDGWFGPGLDSPMDRKITMGDWQADPSKFPDLRATIDRIHRAGGNCILWCAPHAVFPAAECFESRRPLLMHDEQAHLVRTPNGYHVLCLRSPAARRVMADLCVELIERYGPAGAKYDLFNNIPPVDCHCPDHTHDTPSQAQGLHRLLEEIDRRTRACWPGFITELKQNYGSPWLQGFGTCIRAGDTPYNPTANYLRTAFIAAYTPYAINDYQTVSKFDSPEDTMRMIIRMMAVGIPTYSMDLTALTDSQRQILGGYHRWYRTRLDLFHHPRRPIDCRLSAWKVESPLHRAVFVLEPGPTMELVIDRPTEVLIGSDQASIVLMKQDGTPAPRWRVQHPLGLLSVEQRHGRLLPHLGQIIGIDPDHSATTQY